MYDPNQKSPEGATGRQDSGIKPPRQPNQQEPAKQGSDGPTANPLNSEISDSRASIAEHLTYRALDVFYEIKNDALLNRAVVRAASLSPADVAIAALNGMSFDINYGIPARPNPAKRSSDPIVVEGVASGAIPADALVVSKKENAVLFQHVMWCVGISPHYSPKQIDEVMKLEVLSITENAYVDYIDTLQRASRFFRGEGRRLNDQLAELVALDAHRVLTLGNAPIAATPNAIRPVAEHADGLIVDVLRNLAVQRLLPGSTILLTGGGYNSLLDIEAMKSLPNFQFVIVDQDPFITRVLSHVAAYQGLENVRVAEGGFSGAHRSAPFSALFVSNVTNMSHQKAVELADVAAVTLIAGSPVHICQRETPLHAFAVTPHDVKTAFEKRGFSITMIDEHIHNVSSPPAELRQDQLLAMTGAEIAERKSTHTGPRIPQPYRYTVLRLPRAGDVPD